MAMNFSYPEWIETRLDMLFNVHPKGLDIIAMV